MARIRSIKPEFWTSEQIAECSPNTRLLFIGMWSFADDSGVHPANVTRLKMEIFPGDSFTREEMMAMVDQLLKAGLIQEYSVKGEAFWRVTGWKHQKIDQPTYKFPLPDGNIPNTPNRRRTNDERSPNTQRMNGECSLLEGSGEDKEGGEFPAGLSPLAYARGILERQGLPLQGNQQVLAESIESFAKAKTVVTHAAAEQIERRMVAARERGEKVNKFWFTDGKYLEEEKPKPKPVISAADEMRRQLGILQ